MKSCPKCGWSEATQKRNDRKKWITFMNRTITKAHDKLWREMNEPKISESKGKKTSKLRKG